MLEWKTKGKIIYNILYLFICLILDSMFNRNIAQTLQQQQAANMNQSGNASTAQMTNREV